ncbi:MAG TPA: DUF1588 domain-containing protein, partial [Polyangiaceae bacterium]
MALGAGAFTLLSACSGKYQTDGNPSSSASDGGATSAGSPSSATSGAVGGGGVPNAASAGPPSIAVAGAPSYCGVQLPMQHASELAAPVVVWNRVQSFLLSGTVSPPPPSLPAVTTRDWALSLANDVLSQYPPALQTPGMVRFMVGFWPNTMSADRYAAEFNGSGTVAGLLQFSPDGPGLLVDPAVLRLHDIPARGAYILQNLLCVNIPLPPPTLMPPTAPGVIPRAPYEAEIAAPVCVACHRYMDPLGDALEHYAIDGTFYANDQGQPI